MLEVYTYTCNFQQALYVPLLLRVWALHSHCTIESIAVHTCIRMNTLELHSADSGVLPNIIPANTSGYTVYNIVG